MFFVSNDRQLAEPVPVDDDLCMALARIEDLGFAARFVLLAEHPCYEARGAPPLAIVKRKIVLPYRAIRPGIDMTARFLARRAGRRRLRLVT